jgi:hypothetical protein
MSSYNLSKVLYFASKSGGLHVSDKERRDTDLSTHVRGAKKQGLLGKVTPPNGAKAGSYYSITDEGNTILLGLQIGERLRMNKSVNDTAKKLSESLERTMPKENRVQLAGLLSLGAKGVITEEDAVKLGVGKKNTAIRMMNRFNMLQTSSDNKGAWPKALTSAGEALSQVFAVGSSPDAIKLTGDALVAHQLTQLFKHDNVLSFDHNAPPNIGGTGEEVQSLVVAGYLGRVATDDAYQYYKPTDKGLDVLRHEELKERRVYGALETGLFADRLQSVESTERTIPTYGYGELVAGMDFGQYSEKGQELALEAIGKESLSGLNDLHWDDAFDRGMSIEDAVNALRPVADQLKMNSPAALKERHTNVLNVLNELRGRLGGDLENNQMVGELQKSVKDQLGYTLDRSYADHMVRGNPKINVLNVSKVNIETLPKPKGNDGEEPEYNFEKPALRPH